ncbi:MAG: hypothetical protein AAFZ18_22545 [Myxococcota bacterium]
MMEGLEWALFVSCLLGTVGWGAAAWLFLGALRPAQADADDLRSRLTRALGDADRATANMKATQARLAVTEAQVTELEGVTERLNAQAQAAEQRLAEGGERSRAAEEELERIQADMTHVCEARDRALSEARARGEDMARLQARSRVELDEAQQTRQRSELDVDELRQRLGAVKQDLLGERGHRLAAERILRILHFDPTSRVAADPLAPAHRLASQEVLEALLIETQATATAVVDARGFTLLAAGEERLHRRLGSVGALAQQLLRPLEMVLGMTPILLSLRRGFRGLHLAALDHGRRWLVVEAHAHAPIPALPFAALRLGARWREGSGPFSARPVGEKLEVSQRGPLDEVLWDWVRRHRASYGFVLAPQAILASTQQRFRRPPGDFSEGISGFVDRSVRDGFSSTDTQVIARSVGGDWLTAVPLSEGSALPCAVVVSSEPIPPESVEELAESLRWQTRAQRRKEAVI